MKMKKLLLCLLCGVMLFSITGCGTPNYTDNMRVVRENFNPWHLETNLNGGDLFDKALKRAKWDDNDGTVTITGTDTKTGDSMEVVFEVADDRAKFISMIQEGEDKSYAQFYRYITNYIE